MASQHKINKSKNQGQPFSGYWTEPTARRKPRSKKFSSWPPRCSREQFPDRRGALGCTASTGTLPQGSLLLSPLPGAEGKSVQGWPEPRGTQVHTTFLYTRGFFNNKASAWACSPLPAHTFHAWRQRALALQEEAPASPTGHPHTAGPPPASPALSKPATPKSCPKPFPALPLPSPPGGSVSA